MESGLEPPGPGFPGLPFGPNSRTAEEEVPSVKTLHGGTAPFSPTIGRSCGQSYPIAGPIKGIELVMGCVDDWDIQFCETTLLPPLEVAPLPPTDRLSAVDSNVSIASTPAIVAVPKRPRLGPPALPRVIPRNPFPASLDSSSRARVCPQTALLLPTPYDELREVPWEGLIPPPAHAPEETRNHPSRVSSTSAASSARLLAPRPNMNRNGTHAKLLLRQLPPPLRPQLPGRPSACAFSE